MKMIKFQLHHHIDPAIERLLNRILSALIKNQEKIMAKLDALTAEVKAISDTDDAVLALIDGLVEQLKNAGSDQGAIDAVVSELEAKRTALAAAVTANTAPAPSPEPNPAA